MTKAITDKTEVLAIGKEILNDFLQHKKNCSNRMCQLCSDIDDIGVDFDNISERDYVECFWVISDHYSDCYYFEDDEQEDCGLCQITQKYFEKYPRMDLESDFQEYARLFLNPLRIQLSERKEKQ